MLSSSGEDHKLKTKVGSDLNQIRRLYDIANVFLALGIIKKAHLDNKKPAFLWKGLEGLQGSIGKYSNLSTASECSRDEYKFTEISNLAMHKIVIPKPYPSNKSIHDTPQLKVQDDFKLSSSSAFRVCKLFEPICKENYPVGSSHTPQAKFIQMSELVGNP